MSPLLEADITPLCLVNHKQSTGGIAAWTKNDCDTKTATKDVTIVFDTINLWHCIKQYLRLMSPNCAWIITSNQLVEWIDCGIKTKKDVTKRLMAQLLVQLSCDITAMLMKFNLVWHHYQVIFVHSVAKTNIYLIPKKGALDCDVAQYFWKFKLIKRENYWLPEKMEWYEFACIEIFLPWQPGESSFLLLYDFYDQREHHIKTSLLLLS